MCKQSVCLYSFVLLFTLIIAGTANSADPDLVCWWKLDGDAMDSSGNNIHGTLSGGPQWVDGYHDGALKLDGVDDYVNLGNPSILPSGDLPRTLCGWGFISGAIGSSWHWILAYGTGAQGQACFIGVRGSDMRLAVGAGWGDQPVGINETPSENYLWEVGEWVHISLTYDGTTAILYKDGAFVTSEPKNWNTVLNSAYIGQQVNGGQFWDGLVDDIRIYNRALTEAEIQQVIKGLPPGQAVAPNPENEATDVPRDVVLGWQPGEFAAAHDVYFGEVFEDVNEADRNNQRNVLVSQDQIAATYDLGRLDFGQTYLWRIDEVNAPPDSTIFKGKVWSFTVEPIGYPIAGDDIIVTASSSSREDEGPENTINGSGLDTDNLHSSANTAMWLTNITDPNIAWIQYEFDRVHKLHQMLVWNYNSYVEPVVGFGIKEATIEYSVNGIDWVPLGTTHEFARGLGSDGYASNTTVDFGGVSAKYVKITANNNWGGIVKQYGLSEVRFLSIPVLAREPNPASGATDVGVDAILSFRAGREAARHDVYLSTDEQAVIDGATPIATMTDPSYATSLDLASTYYWRVDEVNDAETPTAWQGDVWSFSTQEFLAVDDFESYNDVPAEEDGSNLIYTTWVDGFEVTTNGSTMGYTEAFQPSMEKTLFYDGNQSAPLFYDNTTAAYSEITANVADLGIESDWTKHGIKGLTLRFYSDPNNVPQQMYVKINGFKVVYDSDAENLQRIGWQKWYIDLASLGVNLNNVTELAIGFEPVGATGGQGMVLLDSIRLVAGERQLVTPVDPGTAGLQAYYEFEGNTNDSSGKGRNGVVMGNPFFTTGKIGQALSFDGLSDYVNINGYKGLTATNDVQPAFSIACWLKTIGDGVMVSWGSGNSAPVGGQYLSFRIDGGSLRVEHGNGNLRGNSYVNDGEWHHCGLTVVEGGNLRVPQTMLYVDGLPDTVFSGSDNIYNLTADADVSIGRQAHDDTRYISGTIDDVRIYDRVLSQEEIAWLAGRTMPFDELF